MKDLPIYHQKQRTMKRALVFLFFGIFVVAYLYLNVRGIRHISDDDWFSREANTPDIIKWLVVRYKVWSSRTPIEFALLSLINHKQIWAIFNALFIALTVCSLSNIISKNKKDTYLSAFVFILLIIFTIKKDYIKDGILWMTGSFNYLWPFALALAGFSLLKTLKSDGMLSYKSLLIPCMIFLSSFSEQLIVINIILLTAIIATHKGIVKQVSVLSLAMSLLVLIYILLSPGNELRMHLEVSRWNPDFVNINIIEKIMLGLNLSYDQFFSVQPVSILILYLCLYFIYPKRTAGKKISFCLLLLSLALTILQKQLFTILNFNTIYRFNSSDVDGILSIARSAIIIFISVTTTFLIYFSHPQRKTTLLISIFYVASYAGTVMLGLSPTIYASGQRVLMVSSMMISGLATYLAIHSIHLLKNKEENN